MGGVGSGCVMLFMIGCDESWIFLLMGVGVIELH